MSAETAWDDRAQRDADVELMRELLEQTAEAHGRYEKAELGGVYDEQWPAWYAADLVRRLRERGVELNRSAR
ncbi:hypothetical protein [Humibacter ginsenosidimutans]|uniref:Uncharacterized protein n=1 Tax=Humibacter ginsenosidimutans TaxID=2599293 RepID=A0A5B8M3I1_9MICO|nr:hypothetical protein [Humibacter ginsenosidimutans]QDZ14504.1 hypothetical protein FPZ11_06785 [Humibacter ginsenosidimutans]